MRELKNSGWSHQSGLEEIITSEERVDIQHKYYSHLFR